MLPTSTNSEYTPLLIPAMETGEDIQVAGTVSECLYYNLTRPAQAVLQEVLPSLHHIDIHPEDVKPASEEASGVATGFSSGIDSFAVLADHYYADKVPSNFRLTHLLYNNVGSGEEENTYS